eukprot:TRINITY_DN3346_c0_g1_i2.p1 TRINITY_DN3346_c0_g1~~TRINITY_DN3346_c0_g1_i2.p1  ORF type:complete len:354 (-),score=68.06 TRINITY_DN3346_c0_g1_i2:81-1142(-)
MAAYIHQQLAEEIGLANDILSGWNKESQDYQSTRRELLNTAMKDTVNPFKIRLNGVLRENPPVVLLYQLSNVLDFYGRRFMELVGSESDLTISFFECKRETMQAFFASLEKQSEGLKRTPPIPPSDLTPPHEVHENVNKLTEIISIFDSSLVPIKERETEFTVILSAILDPIEQACLSSATKLGKMEQSVYMINCLSTVQSTLEKYDFVTSRLKTLNETIQIYITQVIDLEVSSILKDCGLSQMLSLLKFHESQASKVSLSGKPGMSSSSIGQCTRAFEAYLLDLGTLSMPLVEHILVHGHRSEARRGILSRVASAYAALFEAVNNPMNGYENPESLFRYKPDQVRTILLADL